MADIETKARDYADKIAPEGGDDWSAAFNAFAAGALSHAAGQDSEQCRAASENADFAKMDAVYNFLMGISDLGGVSFGERHPMVRGQFWWRHDLAAAYASIRALSRGVPEGEYPEAAEVCAEAYQVVGCMLMQLGLFDTPEAEKILDNLSQHRMVHRDVLPWTIGPAIAAQRKEG